MTVTPSHSHHIQLLGASNWCPPSQRVKFSGSWFVQPVPSDTSGVRSLTPVKRSHSVASALKHFAVVITLEFECLIDVFRTRFSGSPQTSSRHCLNTRGVGCGGSWLSQTLRLSIWSCMKFCCWRRVGPCLRKVTHLTGSKRKPFVSTLKTNHN